MSEQGTNESNGDFLLVSKLRLKTTPTFALEKQTRLVRKQTRFILTLPVAGAVCSVAPELWENICILTQSVNEGKNRGTATSEYSFHGRIKRLRRAYILSLILFVTNSECSFPFHIALSDAIESCGGSSELIKILNRVGAVASVETLKRTIHSISQDRKDAGVKSLLIENVFTIASADNIDFLQSNAAVYAGDQHRSWHATSMQLVQPTPNICIQPSLRKRLFPSEASSTLVPTKHVKHCASTSADPVQQLHCLLSRKRQERSTSSPICSPQQTTVPPCAKKFKRARTFKESGTCIAEQHQRECIRQHVSTHGNCTTQDSSTSACTISIQSFQVEPFEQKALNELSLTLFKYVYVMLKEALAPDKLFIDCKTFCGMAMPDMPEAQCSNVVYLPIVDMHADTMDAMEMVVSKLYRECKIGQAGSADYMVLAGDQKTFSRIHELKHVYGSELDWLIPFIGDWHLLSNYQSILMKVYYDAGLKPVLQCSHTHSPYCLILQPNLPQCLSCCLTCFGWS